MRHGFVGWTTLGLGFQIKSPKLLAASQPTGGGYAVQRDMEGRQGGDERGPQERSCGGAARSLNTALHSF